MTRLFYTLLDTIKLHTAKSDFRIEYLCKIIDLANQKNMKVYLYASPLHKQYSKKIPKRTQILYENVLDSILVHNPNVKYMNYKDYSLDNKSFGDGDHLNQKGASIISEEINQIINSSKQDTDTRKVNNKNKKRRKKQSVNSQ